MRGLRIKRAVVVGLGTLLLVATAEGDGLKRWTNGTTEAANEVIGPRSGLSFHLADPPGEADPPGGVPVLHVTAVPRTDLLQVIDLSLVDPPEPDVEPLDPVARIELVDPPNPDLPSTVIIRIDQPEHVILVGPTGETTLMCGGR